MINKKIGIIGCGNMGEAILRGLSNLVEKSTFLMVSELDAKRRGYIRSKYKVIVKIDNNEILKFADVVILAVKPKDFEDLLKNEVCCGITKNKVLISIAAGITTKYIEKIVGKDIPVIRVVPNIAAAIGESISGISAGNSATQDDMNLAKEIFSAIGDVVEADEKNLDAVTAVSGSGPAYFCYLIESLVEAARAAGLGEDASRQLVLKTAFGTMKLLEMLKEEPSVLRAKVTSKSGTTEAALKIFESGKFKNIVKTAIKAAQKRAKELSRS